MEIINETRNFCFEVPPSTGQYTLVHTILSQMHFYCFFLILHVLNRVFKSFFIQIISGLKINP